MTRPVLVAAALSSVLLFARAAGAGVDVPAPPGGATAPSIAAPDEQQGFLGWHPAGDLHFVTLLDTSKKLVGVRACRASGDDVPAAWPAGLKVDVGVLCAAVDEAAVGGPVAPWAMSALGGDKPLRTSPWGLKIELKATADGTTTTHAVAVVDPGSKDRALALPSVTAPEALKLGDVVWRKDGAAVAVALETGKPAAGSAARRLIVVADVGALLRGGGAAARRVAIAKEQEAAALMKKRDWSGAGRVLDDALVADPTYAAARYARAAAEAQGGIGRTAMIENLAWLKQAAPANAAAKRLLDGAKRDPAFDAWCGEPEVRELVGLPSVATMDVPTRLTERTATWTLQGASCRSAWVTLMFAGGRPGKDGRVAGQGTLELVESCKGEKKKQKQALSWTQTATGTFELVTKPVEATGIVVLGKATLVLDETHQQLKLAPDGGDTLGTFEPGRALLDDSML